MVIFIISLCSVSFALGMTVMSFVNSEISYRASIAISDKLKEGKINL